MPAGPNHLHGRAVRRYVRSRCSTDDLDRTRRQQQVIWAVRVFNYELLAPYTTVRGAWVFLIRDGAEVDAWIDGLFEAPPLGAES